MTRSLSHCWSLILASLGLSWVGVFLSNAHAQTVQLPTIQVFSVDTTVSVPDGGGVMLGGINRATDSSVTRGVPFGKGPLGANRGLSSTRSGSNVSVHATIIDHQELDAAVLAEAAALRAGRAGSHQASDPKVVALQQKADYLTRNLATSPRPVAVTRAAAPQPSLVEIRQRNESAAAERADETKTYFAKAQTAEAENKPGIAKIYYQMVARRDQGALKTLALARIAALQAPKGNSTLAAK